MEFKKAGFNEKDSLELGRVASMYQNVADQEITAGEAANFIVSQMKAYNLTAQDSEHIIDAVNEVSNKYAVSSADIATNIGKASAAMATGNMTYEQSIGLMTAMTEITRNGAKSARGLVSIQSRYNQILDENSTTGKKLTAWYKEHNIELKDQNGQLKSFFEVGGEVAKQWDKLSDNEKKYYLNAQAGANQSQNLAALMRNYKTALEATATAENSAGSAAKENARYMESMEGKLQNLKSAWEKFSYKMINSDMLKDGIDALTKALDFLSTDGGQNLIKVAGALATLYLPAKKVFGLFAGAKAAKGMSKFASATRIVSKNLKGGKMHFAAGAAGMAKLGTSASRATPLVASFAGLFSGGAVAWGLLGAAGIVAGILALNKAIDGITDPDEKYEKTKKELDKLKEKYKEVNDEIKGLEKKDKKGDLTGAEKQRLAVLKEQSAELEKQIELKKQLEEKQYQKKETAPQTKSKQVKSAVAGKGGAIGKGSANVLKGMSEQTAKQLGYTTKLNAKIRDQEILVGKIGSKYNHTGKVSEKSISKIQDGFKGIKDKTNEYLKRYKKVENIPKSLQATYKAGKKVSDAYDTMGKLSEKLAGGSWSKLKKDGTEVNQTFKDLGDTFGIIVDKNDNIQNVNYGSFISSMKAAGFTTEQTKDALAQLAEENPYLKVNIEGVEVAYDQLGDVEDFLDKLNGDDATATVEIDGVEYAVQDIGSVENYMNLVNGKRVTGDVEITGADTAKEDIKAIDAAKLKDKVLKILGNPSGANKAGREANAIKVKKKTLTIGGKKDGSFTSTVSAYNKPKSRGVTLSVGATISATAQKIMTKLGFAKGTRNAPAGLAEVNEQGFEFIRDAETGKLRIAGGGKRTVTALGKGDTVYTHAESMRMLSDQDDIEIEQHKKGKKGKKKGKKQKKRQKKYDKAKEKITSAFDKALEALEHKRDVEHWTDAQYTKAYNNLYNKYSKKLATFNKNYKGKKAKGVTKSGMGTDRQRAKEKANADLAHDQATKRIEELLEAYDGTDATYDKASKAIKTALAKKQISRDEYNDLLKELKEKKKDYQHEAATKEIDTLIGGQRGTQEDFNKTIKRLKELKKQNKLTAEEAEEYEKEAYKKHIEYEMNTLKFDRNSYKKSLALLEDAYAKKKLTDEEYYAYRQELAEKLLDLEKTEIEKSQELNDNKYSLAKAYVQKQIDALQKENEEQEKQNELIELQNNLLKAKSKRVKVYREGIGFTYEQDTEAIQEATKALQDFQNAQKNPELEKWEKVMELFDKLESSAEMKHLENLIGASAASMFGAMGTDIGSWTNWIKNNLATAYGYADVLSNLDELAEYTDIEAYVNNLSSNIDSAINANRFASGTLNAPRGFARVAENGYEIALLGKGDAVMPHGVSKNLMEWGQYSPKDFVTSGGGDNLTYNFDKLVLPNVDNAHAFISELNKLPNAALQYSKGRR